MTVLTISLPDDVAKLAEMNGILSQAAITALVSEAVLKVAANRGQDSGVPLPMGFDSRLKGKVSPELFGRGKVLGDIVSPLDVRWEADS